MHKSSPTTEEMSDEKASMLLFNGLKELRKASNLLLSTIDKLKRANNAFYGNNYPEQQLGESRRAKLGVDFQRLSKYDRL
jgi:hypothetical protein